MAKVTTPPGTGPAESDPLASPGGNPLAPMGDLRGPDPGQEFDQTDLPDPSEGDDFPTPVRARKRKRAPLPPASDRLTRRQQQAALQEAAAQLALEGQEELPSIPQVDTDVPAEAPSKRTRFVKNKDVTTSLSHAAKGPGRPPTPAKKKAGVLRTPKRNQSKRVTKPVTPTPGPRTRSAIPSSSFSNKTLPQPSSGRSFPRSDFSQASAPPTSPPPMSMGFEEDETDVVLEVLRRQMARADDRALAQFAQKVQSVVAQENENRTAGFSRPTATEEAQSTEKLSRPTGESTARERNRFLMPNDGKHH